MPSVSGAADRFLLGGNKSLYFSFVLEHELFALFVFVELFIYLISRPGLPVHWVGETLPLAPSLPCPPNLPSPSLQPLPLKPPTPGWVREGGMRGCY